jgi:hypothetical protein
MRQLDKITFKYIWFLKGFEQFTTIFLWSPYRAQVHLPLSSTCDKILEDGILALHYQA